MTENERAKALLEGKCCHTCVWNIYTGRLKCNNKENLVCERWKTFEEKPMSPSNNKIYYQKLVYGEKEDERK